MDTYFEVLCRQCRPSSDAAKCNIRARLFKTYNIVSYRFNKIWNVNILNLQIFFVEKMREIFSKLFSFFQRNISVNLVWYKVIKHLSSWSLNELIKLTMLWTTRPPDQDIHVHCLLTEVSMRKMKKWKHPPETPDTRNGLIHMIRIDKSSGQKRVNGSSLPLKLLAFYSGNYLMRKNLRLEGS